MHVVCGCFEVQGLTLKPSKAIYSKSSGTLGQRGCLSQHFAPQAGPARRGCLSLFYRAVKQTSPLPGTFSQSVFLRLICLEEALA